MSKASRFVGLVCALAAVAAIGCGGKKKGSLACKSSAPRPELQGSSSDAVTLRYKFDKAEKVGLDMTVDVHANIKAEGMTGEMDMKMTMTAEMEWSDVTADAATGTMRFTKFVMDMDMSGVPGGQKVHWSSDEPPSGNPIMDSLKAMIGPKVPIKLSTRGELLSMDWSPITSAMSEAGAPSQVTSQLTNDDSLKQGFVMLPEKPVKVGDEWEGGTIEKDVQAAGKMKMKYKYKLAAIAADKNKALIEGEPDIDFGGGGGGMFTVKSSKLGSDVWIEYDVAKGGVQESQMKVCMDLTAEAQGQEADISMEMEGQYKETRAH